MIKKKDMLKTVKGLLLSHKNEWNHGICSNMRGPTECHTTWCKSQRERQKQDISLIFGILNKTWRWLFSKPKHTHRHREQTCGCKEEGGWLREGLGVWDKQTQNIIYRKDRQELSTVEHRNLCEMLWKP